MPTSRIGPGLNDAIKPEFVAPAGNAVFEGTGSLRRINDDRGVAVMSLSHRPTETLFAFDVGTSFAAPRVARIASMLWKRLKEFLGEEPHPNLVRALLASSARVSPPLSECITPLEGTEGVRRVAGYGEIDEDLALDSGDRRLTLIAQSQITLDTFQVFEIPVPGEFRDSDGRKHISVSLAFDPPVRRRRAEYLGMKMQSTLIRGKTLEEVVDAYRAVSAEERENAARQDRAIQGAFQAPFKCALNPGSQALSSSTLQRSEWTFNREGRDYGESWYLVVHAQRNWAPDSITDQEFALAVTLEADQPQLYNLVQQRVRARQQQRARARG